MDASGSCSIVSTILMWYRGLQMGKEFVGQSQCLWSTVSTVEMEQGVRKIRCQFKEQDYHD